MSANTLMTLIRGRSVTQPAPKPDPNLLARFLTAGGAVVELRKIHFQTRYISRPYVLPEGETRPCNGFTWSCHGCGVNGSTDTIYTEPYLDDEKKRARGDANEHAGSCRSMPIGDRR